MYPVIALTVLPAFTWIARYGPRVMMTVKSFTMRRNRNRVSMNTIIQESLTRTCFERSHAWNATDGDVQAVAISPNRLA